MQFTIEGELKNTDEADNIFYSRIKSLEKELVAENIPGTKKGFGWEGGFWDNVLHGQKQTWAQLVVVHSPYGSPYYRSQERGGIRPLALLWTHAASLSLIRGGVSITTLLNYFIISEIQNQYVICMWLFLKTTCYCYFSLYEHPAHCWWLSFT